MRGGALVVLLAGLSSASGYLMNTPPGCFSESFCTEFVEGEEFAEAFNETDGSILSCRFGQTSNDSAANEFCSVPCEEDIEYACICVSEADAKKGLIVEAQFFQLLGIIFTIFIVLLFIVQCYRRRVFYSKAAEFEKAYEAANKDIDKVDLLYPVAPNEVCIWVAYLVSISVAITYWVKMAQVRNGDFWTGCGSQDDLLD